MEEKQAENLSERKRVDVSKLVSVIPSASQLYGEGKKEIAEKRIRIKFDASLPQGIAKISKALANMLNIKENDLVELVVAGKKKFVFKSLIDESQDPNIVLCNPSGMREKGVADNSIATIRKHGSGVE